MMMRVQMGGAASKSTRCAVPEGRDRGLVGPSPPPARLAAPSEPLSLSLGPLPPGRRRLQKRWHRRKNGVALARGPGGVGVPTGPLCVCWEGFEEAPDARRQRRAGKGRPPRVAWRRAGARRLQGGRLCRGALGFRRGALGGAPRLGGSTLIVLPSARTKVVAPAHARAKRGAGRPAGRRLAEEVGRRGPWQKGGQSWGLMPREGLGSVPARAPAAFKTHGGGGGGGGAHARANPGAATAGLVKGAQENVRPRPRGRAGVGRAGAGRGARACPPAAPRQKVPRRAEGVQKGGVARAARPGTGPGAGVAGCARPWRLEWSKTFRLLLLAGGGGCRQNWRGASGPLTGGGLRGGRCGGAGGACAAGRPPGPPLWLGGGAVGRSFAKGRAGQNAGGGRLLAGRPFCIVEWNHSRGCEG
ncbi:hypothetical protein Rsub_05969 [Raphidocelis subcapitata]|uniref:Uncharacterized protein n=1 Tax=Raphidocelis subcapitata TaxID=307507 RepID=A0A2V0P7S6_9CHLO|nr:hypothetical protein Rsub_05969 [Raphidocelis subcapitata]|eukprot:GBF93237.1 hypothetical protein Rsub_05969 [Raphidocelis subcapitata]